MGDAGLRQGESSTAATAWVGDAGLRQGESSTAATAWVGDAGLRQGEITMPARVALTPENQSAQIKCNMIKTTADFCRV